MSVIGIISMKGGVGKTSTTANLAASMSVRLGPGRVSVIDLDPQDSLHWHFGLDAADGVCSLAQGGISIGAALQATAFDLACLPYGNADEAAREGFEALLAQQPDWLGRQIDSAGLSDNAVVLIDTPPGPSVYLRQVFSCADLILIVLLADMASYATIPAMESWLDTMTAHGHTPPCMYVLNQVNSGDTLSRDVTDTLREHLGARLSPVRIHRDEAVGEALAFQQPVLMYDPHGQASHDMSRLASSVIDLLNR